MRMKVGVYTRLSEEDKDKKNNDESESIQNQKRMLLEYAIRNDWDVVEIYCDEDYSGAGVFRPDFERMIKDCENKKLDIVLCKSQSRFSRDMEVIERYLHNKFIEWSVRFISLVDNVDTDNKGNKKSRQINGLVNEWYLEDLSENIRRTIRNKKEAGQFTGSFAPYGYQRNKRNKHKLVIDPVASLTVKMIFEMYKEGKGYKTISQYLNDLNILSPYEYKKSTNSKFVCGTVGKEKSYWTKDTIAKILKDEVYIGNLVQGKTKNLSYKNKKKVPVPRSEWIIVKNTHKPIIDKQTWDIVSKKFVGRLKPASNGEIHLFSRKVYCECCKKAFHNGYAISKTGKKHYYLNCHSKRSGNRNCDNKFGIRFNHLEEFILNEINDYIKNYYNYTTLEEKSKSINNQKTKIQDKVRELEKEKELIEKQTFKKHSYLRKMYEDRLEDIISDNDYKNFSKNYHEEISELEKRLDLINDEITTLNKKQTDIADKSKILKKYKSIKILDRIVLDEFIDKIYIGKVNELTSERNITIEWNI